VRAHEIDYAVAVLLYPAAPARRVLPACTAAVVCCPASLDRTVVHGWSIEGITARTALHCTKQSLSDHAPAAGLYSMMAQRMIPSYGARNPICVCPSCSVFVSASHSALPRYCLWRQPGDREGMRGTVIDLRLFASCIVPHCSTAPMCAAGDVFIAPSMVRSISVQCDAPS
jgi:hypothetical protein